MKNRYLFLSLCCTFFIVNGQEYKKEKSILKSTKNTELPEKHVYGTTIRPQE